MSPLRRTAAHGLYHVYNYRRACAPHRAPRATTPVCIAQYCNRTAYIPHVLITPHDFAAWRSTARHSIMHMSRAAHRSMCTLCTATYPGAQHRTSQHAAAPMHQRLEAWMSSALCCACGGACMQPCTHIELKMPASWQNLGQ